MKRHKANASGPFEHTESVHCSGACLLCATSKVATGTTRLIPPDLLLDLLLSIQSASPSRSQQVPVHECVTI